MAAATSGGLSGSLLFAAYDHGAKNMLRPVFRRALAEGCSARFVDLEEAIAADDDGWVEGVLAVGVPQVLVVGLSGNRCEWSLVAACKRAGAGTAMLAEIGPGKRFDGIVTESYPDSLLVSNDAFAAELAARGCGSSQIRVVGNCHLQQLAARDDFGDESSLRSLLRVDPQKPILSFFGAKDAQTLQALEALRGLLLESIETWALVVRPHPHMDGSLQEALAQACSAWPGVHFAAVSSVETPDLLRHSVASFTMGSTVSAESIVMGTPSAFFQAGWSYQAYDGFFANLVSIPRIRGRDDLLEFLGDGDLRGMASMMDRDIEVWDGALQRIWEVLMALPSGRLALDRSS
jgi:hypothetical protein